VLESALPMLQLGEVVVVLVGHVIRLGTERLLLEP
jgi:hypothetical protein